VDIHGVFHAGPVHLNNEQRLAVKHEMETLGLEPRNYVCHSPHNIPTATEAEMQKSFNYLAEAIDMALLWGINQIMLNAGTWAYRLSREASWEKSIRFLQRICDYAAPREIFIAQEAEPFVWFMVNDITSTLKMLEDVNRPNFTTLVDLGHMALAREGPQELKRLGNSIVHAHISDHEPLEHTNQTVGTGFVQISDYLDELKAMDVDNQMKRFGYDELVVSVELGFPGDTIDDPDAMARRSLEHVKEIAKFMKLI
jgi:sugar phosphate isomerase/epimerase